MPTTPSFALVGGLTDLKNPQRFPLFSSPSSRFYESQNSDRGYELAVLPADQSPVTQEGHLYFEGGSRNLLSYSNDLSNPLWVVGDGVDVDYNWRSGPSQTYLADLINFGSGRTGGTQKITRTLTVKPGRIYKRSILLSWLSGVPDSTAIATVTGGVASVTSVSLRDKLTTKNRWELIEVGFTSAGRQPTYPTGFMSKQFAISAIAQNVITLTGVTEAISIDALQGGKVKFDNSAQTEIEILNNGAQSNGFLQLTLKTAPPANAGITLTSRVMFQDADLQTVTLELSSNAALSLLWGGEQVEETLRTTLIQTLDQPLDRAPIQCRWQPHHNPLGGLRNFGLYLDLPVLRGDCRIVEFVGDLTVAVTATQIQATLGGLTLSAPRPSGGCKLFVQVSDEVGKASLYLNGVLVAQSPVSGFLGRGDDWFHLGGLESERFAFSLAELALFDCYVPDGAIAVGQPARDDVAALFTTSPIPTDWIVPALGGFLMPPVQLPAASGTTPSEVFVRFPVAPKASQIIEAIDSTAKTVTLRESAVGYSAGQAYSRDAWGRETAIVEITAVDPLSRRITVTNVTGLAVGQELFQGRSDLVLNPRLFLANLLTLDPEVEIVPRADGLVYRNGAIGVKTVPGAQVTVLL